MARASQYTGLSIDEWAAILGISPFDINQFRYPGTKSAQCKDVIFQYAWQRDHLSREEIAEAIASAESMIAEQCLFWPYPHYVIDEQIPYPRNYNRRAWGFAGDMRGDWKSVGLANHKFIKGG